MSDARATREFAGELTDEALDREGGGRGPCGACCNMCVIESGEDGA